MGLFTKDTTYVLFIDTFIQKNFWAEPACFLLIYKNENLVVYISKMKLDYPSKYAIVEGIYTDCFQPDYDKGISSLIQVYCSEFHQFCESVKKFQNVNFETRLNESWQMDLFLDLFGIHVSLLDYDRLYESPDFTNYNCSTISQLLNKVLF